MNRSFKRGIPCARIAAAIMVCAASAQAAIVYEQLPDGTGNGYFSDGNQGVQFYDNRIADNFTLSSATSITQVQWWGGSENFFGPPDILPQINSFVISFYNNVGGFPVEPPIYTETIPLANITATLTGNTNVVGGLEYLFEANLAAPVPISAGTPYSLHIGAILVFPQDDAFVWHTADADTVLTGDGLGAALNDGTWELVVEPEDTAFRLLNAESGGRCCLPSGDCIIDDETDCTTAGGTFGGDNTACGNGSICRGRCCDQFGGCEVTGPIDCVAPAIFAGLDTNCSDPTICQGRCCAPSGVCTLTGPADCVAPNSFGGLGTSCANIVPFGNPNPPTVAIPDAGAAPPSVITVTENFPIQDLDVRVKIQHTFRVDLILCLTAPGGSPTIQLSTGTGCTTGGDCGGEDNLNVIYNDEGAVINCASVNIGNINATPDQVIPGTALSTFDGLPSAGDWTLNIFDQFGGDAGTLLEWELLLDNGNACQGACCALNGSCSITGQLPCQENGGTFQGAATDCSPSPCAPNGACCQDALCSIQSQIDCTAAGGVFGGVDSTCTSPVPCQASCCKPDGSCDLRTIASCNAIEGGFPGTLGSTCPEGSCLGRCCTPGGSCSLTVPELCTAPNSFGGLGTSCANIVPFGDPNPPTVAIPDFGPAAPSIISVADNFPIQDLDVRVKIQHTYRGDVVMCLTGPGGSPTVFLTGAGSCATGGYCFAEQNLNAVFNDEGAALNCASANLANLAATPDQLLPAAPLSAFDGLPTAGDWTLAIIDDVGGDQGTLLEWELLFDNGNACQGACCALNGSCSITGQLPCQEGGGTFQGAATDCSPSPCAPNGACCQDALCSIQSLIDCTAAGGVFGGVNTSCANPAPCQASCCKPDGSCDLRTIASCNAIEGGFPGALGSSCPAGNCRGRCCLANGNCSVIPVEACAGVSSPGVLNCDPVQVFQFNDVNMVMEDVPDGVISQNIQTVETNGSLIITDLDVDLNVIHTWPGDVQITIEHLGMSVIIYDRPGNPQSTFGCATPDFNIILDDEGTGGPIETICNTNAPSAQSPPNYTPNNVLSAFDGLEAAGEWTLISRDFFSGADTGTLLSWSLHIGFNGQACPVGGCTCFGDMNGDTVVNGGDINLFSSCVAAGGAGCPCGDMDHSGSATSADVTTFVTAVMTSTCGAPPP